MKRKWNKLLSGAVCISLALPGSLVYAGGPEYTEDYSEAQATEEDNEIEVFDAIESMAEPEVTEEDESLLFSASEESENDVFSDGDSEAQFFADEEPVLVAGESIPIDAAHFPDDNFRAYLLDWETTFGNGDGILDVSEISQITELSCSDFNISGSDEYNGTADYAGIEYLTALEKLEAFSSNPDAPFLLDVSKNVRLKELSVSSDTKVSFSLDVSKNTALEEMSINISYERDYESESTKYVKNQNIVFGQALTALEKLTMEGAVSEYFDVATFPGLNEIEIRNCSINNLKISGCKALSKCELQNIENFNSIEFGTLPALEELDIDDMQELTELSIQDTPCLENLHIYYTGLEKLSLPFCPRLKYLTLRENRLKKLDLSTCPNLERGDVSFNELTTLDITGLSKLERMVCLLNDLKEIKGNKDKLVGYPAGQREAEVKLYGNILYTSQIWSGEKLWLAKITNYRGITPAGEDPGYGVDAAMCQYFTVDPFEGNSTEVSFDLSLVSKVIPVKLHLTKAQNTVIDVPQRLMVSDAWKDGVELSWNHVLGADGYYIYRKVNDSAWKKVATVKGGNKNTYTDSTTTWAKYTYKVKAYGKVNGKNAVSKYSKTDTLIKPYQEWKSKFAVKAGTKSAALTWKKLNGASGYQIYRSTSKKGKYTKIATIKKGTTVKYTDSKLQAKKTYYYKIRPYLTVDKKNNYGSFSGIVKATVK